ncbi:hypothetical protein [Inquilinus limosus]|uniref:hypothetical protein n=1 Tax=Inquilinus limosus TaxID=171674 RepID=UPI000407D19A|nr:hypothetical protein [Inquilinus limosus]
MTLQIRSIRAVFVATALAITAPIAAVPPAQAQSGWESNQRRWIPPEERWGDDDRYDDRRHDDRYYDRRDGERYYERRSYRDRDRRYDDDDRYRYSRRDRDRDRDRVDDPAEILRRLLR